jgi:hypothetical protein
LPVSRPRNCHPCAFEPIFPALKWRKAPLSMPAIERRLSCLTRFANRKSTHEEIEMKVTRLEPDGFLDLRNRDRSPFDYRLFNQPQRNDAPVLCKRVNEFPAISSADSLIARNSGYRQHLSEMPQRHPGSHYPQTAGNSATTNNCKCRLNNKQTCDALEKTSIL